MIAAVVVRNASDQLHARALATLRALLPHVGIDAPGIYACDLAGTERVLGAPSRVARRIVERLARVSAPAAVAVAITPFAARVAAERTADGDVRLVTEPREYLAPLPIEVLPIDPKLVDELGLLGLRSVGDFAALPRGAVFDRFGRGAARAHALARAEDEERVRADPPPKRIRSRRNWEDALVSREQLVFALKVLCGFDTREIADLRAQTVSKEGFGDRAGSIKRDLDTVMVAVINLIRIAIRMAECEAVGSFQIRLVIQRCGLRPPGFILLR